MLKTVVYHTNSFFHASLTSPEKIVETINNTINRMGIKVIKATTPKIKTEKHDENTITTQVFFGLKIAGKHEPEPKTLTIDVSIVASPEKTLLPPVFMFKKKKQKKHYVTVTCITTIDNITCKNKQEIIKYLERAVEISNAVYGEIKKLLEKKKQYVPDVVSFNVVFKPEKQNQLYQNLEKILYVKKDSFSIGFNKETGTVKIGYRLVTKDRNPQRFKKEYNNITKIIEKLS